jgi:glycosyltransferase involved in cell wall biosynthesis
MKIALGVPEWEPFEAAMRGEPADATYVIQANLSQGLKARGHSLVFIGPKGPEDFIFTAEPCEPRVGLRTWSAGRPFHWTSKLSWKVQQWLRIPYLNVFSNYRFYDAALQSLGNVDVVYERNGLYSAGLAMAAKRLKLPYVIFVEADQIMELDIMGKPLTGLLRWRANHLFRYNLHAADSILCVTEAGKRRLMSKWKVRAEKILVFPNAVYVDRFKPDRSARAQVRASLGMNLEPMIVFVGNFFHWHDVSTLLKAFAAARRDCSEARLVLVGEGERRAEVMKQASELGLDHALRFTGIVPHSEVPRYMAAADIAVVPYPDMQQEMWLSPLKLFEYMSSGKAIVASAVGQIVEIVEDGRNGVLVPPGDVSAMSRAFVHLIRDVDLCSKLGAQAREDAILKYSWDGYFSRLERVFTAVIAHQSVQSV